MIREIEGKRPYIGKNCYHSPLSVITGDVTLASEVNVWDFVAIRGDIASITIGKGSNIQENSSLHVDHNAPLIIGENVTIGHNCVIHGCEIGDSVLIGMGSIILTGSKIPNRCIIGAGAVITSKMQLLPGEVWIGNPAQKMRDEKVGQLEQIEENARVYRELALKMKEAKEY